MNKKENIEITQSGERKASLNWNKWDVIFIVLPIILIILEPLGGFSYLDGRFDSPSIFLIMILMLPVNCVIIIICFLASIVRLLVHWRNHTRKKKLVIAAQIGMPLVFIILFVTPFFSWPGYKPFTYGFRDRIRSKADIEDIRDWLRTLSKEDYGDQGVLLPFDKLPESLKVLNPPPRICVSADENGNPKVSVMWGSGFLGLWGVVIGMEDMEIPPSDLSLYGEYRLSVYRLSVEPGVYVWHEIQ